MAKTTKTQTANKKSSQKTTRKSSSKKSSSSTISLDMKQFLVPATILISGILVACSIIIAFGGNSVSLPFLSNEQLECDTEEPLSTDCLKQYAKDAGLKYSKFKSCLLAKKYDSVIDEELKYAEEIGARGTPHVVIGKMKDDNTFEGFYAGAAQGYDYYQKIIEDVKNLGLEKASKNLMEDTFGDREKLEQLYRDAYTKQGISGEELEKYVKQGVDSEFERYTIKEYKIGDGIVVGNKDAKIVLMEFSEFECPYCKNFAQNTLPDIRKNYIDTGEIKYVFVDFPLEQIHKKARKAANAARCANEQAKFVEYHDKLFGLDSKSE